MYSMFPGLKLHQHYDKRYIFKSLKACAKIHKLELTSGSRAPRRSLHALCLKTNCAPYLDSIFNITDAKSSIYVGSSLGFETQSW